MHKERKIEKIRLIPLLKKTKYETGKSTALYPIISIT